MVERAVDFFWAKGFRGAGMADLLKHLGMGRQSFYDTFGSKRGLYFRAIERYRSCRLGKVLEQLAGPGSPLGNVRKAVRFFEELALDKGMRGCFVANALLEAAGDDEEMRKFLQETLGMLEEGYYKALVRAREQGELAEHKSPRAIARALTNASIGLAATGRLGQGRAATADIYRGTLEMLG